MYSVVGICEAAAALVAKNTNSSYFSFASKLCSEKMQSLFFCKKKSLVTLQRGVAPWKWKFRKYKIVFLSSGGDRGFKGHPSDGKPNST